MAQLSKSPFQNLKGSIGKQLVFKQYGNKTIVSKYPDMSRIEPSPRQTEKRRLFAEAVAYARSVNNNPLLKKAYAAKIGAGQSVYHYALQEYLKEAPKNG